MFKTKKNENLNLIFRKNVNLINEQRRNNNKKITRLASTKFSIFDHLFAKKKLFFIVLNQ